MTANTPQRVDVELRALINTYWDLAYAEGRDGRTHDTPDGAAMQCAADIDNALSALLPATSEGENNG